MPDWKVTSSQYLSRRPWFTVRRESLELPNGNRIPEYYVLEYPEWVNVIALTATGKMLLIRQYRHALGRMSLEIPAGVCEKSDPSVLAAARRELREETGYGGGDWREFLILSANPATQTNLTHTFLARNVEPQSSQQLDEGEMLTVEPMEQAEVFQRLQNGEIIQALMAAPLWKFFSESGMRPSERV